MSAELLTRSSRRNGLDLDPVETIVYKFYGLSREEIPQGIREVTRQADNVVDQRHADKATARGDQRSALVGRVRPGRVDTGIPVYQNEQWIQIGSLRSVLALEGYALVDVHFFQAPGKGCVLCLNLSQKGDAIAQKLPRSVIEGLRRLARESTFKVSVWDNPTDDPEVRKATVNFHARAKQRFPDGMLAVRTGFLKITNLEGGDPFETERLEDARAGEELLATIEELDPDLAATLRSITN